MSLMGVLLFFFHFCVRNPCSVPCVEERIDGLNRRGEREFAELRAGVLNFLLIFWSLCGLIGLQLELTRFRNFSIVLQLELARYD